LYPTVVKGQLRLSQRAIDLNLSATDRPVLLLDQERPLDAGAIVCADIAIDPVALKFRVGETLRLRVAGHNLAPIPLPSVKSAPPRGRGFALWCGGSYDSRLSAPLRPV
jgi:predicted acyl esterase